tara:strand:- start:126 stop:458 length:333 start_codon:yes stop_codon:yes gene_type:complete
MVILLRVLLVLLPIILLLVWVRWRSKVNNGGEIPESEVKSLRLSLFAIVIAIMGVGIGLKLSDESGDVDGVYVPARVENGTLIPGYFKPQESDKKETPSTDDSAADSEKN